MTARYWIALLIGLVWWSSALVCIDWVLNFSLYKGMLEPLWMMEIPFTKIEVIMNPWQAYYLSVIQLHGALILISWSLSKLCSTRSA